MNMQHPRVRSQRTKLNLIDVDIHPKSSVEDLRPYLSNRWWDYLLTYGSRHRHGYVKGFPYPKTQPQAARRDAWPETGGLPGSDIPLMREQLLDLYGVEYGIMNPLSPTGQGEQNTDFSAALAFAANEYQIQGWVKREPRLKASVLVPYEDGPALRRRNSPPRGQPRFRACAAAQPDLRIARQEALLADLRSGLRGQAACRDSCLRL